MIPLIFGIGLIIYILSVLFLCVIYGDRGVDLSPIAVLVMFLPLVNTIAMVISFNDVKSDFMEFMHDLRGNKKKI